MRLLRVAMCNLNQWAMDFDTNLRNVKESIVRAKVGGATVRVGPELELTGYDSEDHFLEQDAVEHASLAAETCEELITANAPRIDLALNGVEVFMNASGSHHQLRKLNLRIDSIRNATRLCGGVYKYANQHYYRTGHHNRHIRSGFMRTGCNVSTRSGSWQWAGEDL